MKNRYKNAREILKLVFKTSPLYMCVLIINMLVGSVQIYVNLLIPKIAIEQLANISDITGCIILVLIITLSNIALSTVENFMKYVLNIHIPSIREKMKAEMAEKTMTMPYYILEDNRFMDLKEQAIYAINEQGAIFNIVYNFTEFFRNVAVILSVIGIVLNYSLLYTGILLGVVGLIFVLYIKYLDYQKEFYDNLACVNRRGSFYEEIAYDKKYGMDFRLFKTKDLLEKKYENFVNKCSELMDKFNENKGRYLATFCVIDNTIKLGAYGYIGLRRFSNFFGEVMSIGACVMYVNAISSFSSRIAKISENVVQIRQMQKYLEPYIEFMQFKDEKYTGTLKLENDIEEIRFERVCFKYPRSRDYVLKNINFTIRKGEVVAFAGKNGAGKTTIIKLLCRLYTPTEGKIYINGIDIMDYDMESYIDDVSAIFQDYKIFNWPLIRNINSKGENNIKVRQLLKELKLDKMIEQMPEGIKTIIGKEYDAKGTELSGGQCQKIAIALSLIHI